MEESDVDEKRKKFHKLQEHIPFIEAQLKLIRESKNDDVVKRRSKLESLHKLLTSEFDKRIRLTLLLNIEEIINSIRNQLGKKLSTGIHLKQVKQERSEAENYRTSMDTFQSPESPPSGDEKKNEIEPINIPTERTGGKSYSYDTKCRKSDGYHHKRSNYDERDNDHHNRRDHSQHYRNHSDYRYRDRHSRSPERKYNSNSRDSYKYSDRRDKDYEKRDREYENRHRERDSDSRYKDRDHRDYSKYDHKIKTEKWEDDHYDRNARNNSKSRNNPSKPFNFQSSTQTQNRGAVFRRLGSKVPDHDRSAAFSTKNNIEESFMALEMTNKERYGMDNENKELQKKFDKIKELEKMEEEMKKAKMVDFEKQLLATCPRKNKLETVSSSSMLGLDLENATRIAEQQIATAMTNPPSLLSNQSNTNSAKNPKIPPLSERLAYKFNPKPRTRVESNDSVGSPNSISSPNGSISGYTDPRLRNRDPRAISDNTAYHAPLASSLTQTFNSFGQTHSPSIGVSSPMHNLNSVSPTQPFNQMPNLIPNQIHPNAIPNSFIPPRSSFGEIPPHRYNADAGMYNNLPPPPISFDNTFHQKSFDNIEASRKAKPTYGEYRKSLAQQPSVSSTSNMSSTILVSTKESISLSETVAVMTTVTTVTTSSTTVVTAVTPSITSSTLATSLPKSSTKMAADAKNASKKETNKNLVKTTANLKKNHFDRAFRNNDWEALPAKASDSWSKSQFKIPKLTKSIESSQNKSKANDAQNVESTNKSAHQSSEPVTSKHKERISLIDKNIVTSNSTQPVRRASLNTQQRKASNTSLNDMSEERLCESETTAQNDIEQPQSTTDIESAEPATTSDIKRLQETLLKLQQPNNEGILSIFEQVLDPDKFAKLKSVFNDEGNTNDDEAVTSSTPAPSTIKRTGKSDSESRSNSTIPDTVSKKVPKRRLNELDRLREDISTMFISKGVLTATGKRICTNLQKNDPAHATKQNQQTRTGVGKTAKSSNQDIDTEIPKKPSPDPKPTRVLRRRMTTVDREASSKIEQIPAKRIARRRDTVCEVVDSPKDGDEAQRSIKIKIFTQRSTEETTENNKSNESGSETNSDVEHNKKRKSNKIGNNKTKVTQIPLNANPPRFRPNLARECKVVLEKINIEKLTRPKKRSSESNNDDSSSEAKKGRVVPKNDDKQMCEKYVTKCALCGTGDRYLVRHYVTAHPNEEVYIARLAEKMIEKLNREPAPLAVYEHGKLTAHCYYCEEEITLDRISWAYHLTRHTGEYMKYCKDCDYKIGHRSKAKGTCKHSNVGVLNDIEFTDTMYVHMCKLCNYTQIQEKNLKQHLRNMHDKTVNLSEYYSNIVLIPNFARKKEDRLALEEKYRLEHATTITATECKEPENADVFKPSEQDDGLFDDDTMKLMKENTFNESPTLKVSSSFTMINKLSERFRKQDEVNVSKEKKESEIASGSVSINNPQPKVSSTASNDIETKSVFKVSVQETETQSKATKAEASSVDTVESGEKPIDVISDVDGWESCSTESEEEDDDEVLKQNASKHTLIASTLSRLYSAIGKSRPNGLRKVKSKRRFTPIVIKKEKFGSLTKEAQPQHVPDSMEVEQNPAPKLQNRIDNIGFAPVENVVEYYCFIGNCDYKAKESTSLLTHLREHREAWNGFCHLCDKQLYNTPMGLTKEFKHMEDVHLQKPEPKPQIRLKVRRFSGDKLSTVRQLPTSANSPPQSQPNEPVSVLPSTSQSMPAHQTTKVDHLLNNNNLSFTDMQYLPVEGENVLKPWTKCLNTKALHSIEKLSRQISLIALYKCMAIDCIFSTNRSDIMLEHLLYHEDFLAQQETSNRRELNEDTSSWLECCYCDQIADSCALLVLHIDKEHASSVFQCPYCFYRSVAAANVSCHLSRYHPNHDKQILLCYGKTKQLKDDIDELYEKQLKRIKPIPCGHTDCNKSFIDINELMHHFTLHTEYRQHILPCPICKIELKKDLMINHLTCHHIGQFQCIYCEFGCLELEHIRSHLSDAHPTKLVYAAMRTYRNQGIGKSIRKLALLVNVRENVSTSLFSDSSYTINQLNFMKPSLAEYPHNAADFFCDDDESQCGDVDLNHVTIEYLNREEKQIQEIENSYDIVQLSDIQLATAPTVSLFLHKPTIVRPENSAPLNAAVATHSPLVISHVEGGVDIAQSTTSSVQNEIDIAAKSLVQGTGLEFTELFRCGEEKCGVLCDDEKLFQVHLLQHTSNVEFSCYHCKEVFSKPVLLKNHIKSHSYHRYFCYCCNSTGPSINFINQHFSNTHQNYQTVVYPLNPNHTDSARDMFVICPRGVPSIEDFGMKLVDRNKKRILSTKKFYLPEEAHMLPHQAIFNEPVTCQLCPYNSKVRANIYRHLIRGDCKVNAAFAETDPINPMPCLDTGEKYFDKMRNLAASSNTSGNSLQQKFDQSLQFVPVERRFVCGAKSCHYQTQTDSMLRTHIETLHESDTFYNCPHCNTDLCSGRTTTAVDVMNHLRFHDTKLFKCPICQFHHFSKAKVDKHIFDLHPKCKDKARYIVRCEKQPTASKQSKSTWFRWKCNVCLKAAFDTRALVKEHLLKSHRLSFQYQCMMCSFQNDIKNVVREHIINEHGADNATKIKTMYERVDGDADVTPIWRRDDPNRMKFVEIERERLDTQIRNIIYECLANPLETTQQSN